jgi:hypothetical protein
MKTSVTINDALYKKTLFNQKKEFDKQTAILKKRGVLESKIKELHNRELVRMQNSIFEMTNDGDIEFNNDPFMAAMLISFSEMLEVKEPNSIEKLFKKRKAIENSSRNIKFYGDDDLINQPDEVVLEFIAKYQLYRGISLLWEAESAFQLWQNQNILELSEVFNPNSINDFLEVEKRIFSMKFINAFGKWAGEKKYLVAAILKLVEFNFIKRKIQENTCVRVLFEKRYGISISKEYQKNRRKNITAAHLKPFEFIKEYDQIK